MADLDIYSPRKKKAWRAITVTPVLDVMFTIIFFLLVATSFEAYTKLTVPPSHVSPSPQTATEPPAIPGVIVHDAGTEFRIELKAGGKAPVSMDRRSGLRNLRSTITKMVQEYMSKNPSEKTMQLTLESQLSYEILVKAMDGIRSITEDIVLVAPQDQSKGKTLQESVL